jgi:hypothetical protein
MDEDDALDIERHARGNQPDPSVPLITPFLVSVEPSSKPLLTN